MSFELPMDWLKHLYGFSSGLYFAAVLMLVLYGLSYRKKYNWKVSAAFFLVAASYVCFGLYNLFFHTLFTDITQPLYSKGFLKFCAMMTPVSVLVLTYIYIQGFTLRSVSAYKRVKKEAWIAHLIYASTVVNIIAIYFVDDHRTIALMLLLGFILPTFGAARLAMVSNEKSMANVGYAVLFGGLLVLILTAGMYSINHPNMLPATQQVMLNVGFAIFTFCTGVFSIRYGYEEIWSFFVLREMDKRGILSDITTGIHENQFSLHYQPQLDLQTGKVTAAEALIRWEHPEKGNIAPLDYIPLAEESGLMSHITMWVITRAIVEANQLRQRGFELKISINFSPKDITQHVVSHLEKTLIRYDYPSELVVVEITESQMINSEDTTFSAAMARLHELGVSISIDDYGTGFSSLSHMQRLHIHELKIDQAFVKELDYDTSNYAIVYSTLQMARNLQLITVAEGVEDAATLNMLKELKCNFAQGYGIAKPMAFDAFVDWLHEHKSERTDMTEEQAA